eukprot:12583524-Heterocapsa_arctica.AAC.1
MAPSESQGVLGENGFSTRTHTLQLTPACIDTATRSCSSEPNGPGWSKPGRSSSTVGCYPR